MVRVNYWPWERGNIVPVKAVDTKCSPTSTGSGNLITLTVSIIACACSRPCAGPCKVASERSGNGWCNSPIASGSDTYKSVLDVLVISKWSNSCTMATWVTMRISSTIIARIVSNLVEGFVSRMRMVCTRWAEWQLCQWTSCRCQLLRGRRRRRAPSVWWWRGRGKNERACRWGGSSWIDKRRINGICSHQKQVNWGNFLPFLILCSQSQGPRHPFPHRYLPLCLFTFTLR